MSLIQTKTLVLYTVILSFFGLFTGMIFGGVSEFEEKQYVDEYNLLSKSQEIASDIEDLDVNGFITSGLYASLTSDWYSLFQKTGLSFFIGIPLLIINITITILSIPFLPINFLPPVASVIIYIPYTIIIFFDVVIPLVLKILDILGDYIPFT